MKIALIGYGKMGKTIEQLATTKGHSIVYKSTSTIKDGTLASADVAIEFSNPEAAVSNIKKCFEANVPVICGTTGWLKNLNEVLAAQNECNGSFLYASNFSVGVNLFFQLNEELAKKMRKFDEYDVTIKEIHHTEKKDAPSGTAITLAESILHHSDKKEWSLDKAENDKLYIDAKRINDVKGTHIVTYASKIDTISINHEAHSREGFAKGAILAAEWILGKQGVFSMKNVIDSFNDK